MATTLVDVCYIHASHTDRDQVDQIPKEAVVFISQPAPHVNACYGGLMSLRAQILGAKGVVIDGRLRDLQEHRDLKFPVSAQSCTPSLAFLLTLSSSLQEVSAQPLVVKSAALLRSMFLSSCSLRSRKRLSVPETISLQTSME